METLWQTLQQTRKVLERTTIDWIEKDYEDKGKILLSHNPFLLLLQKKEQDCQ